MKNSTFRLGMSFLNRALFSLLLVALLTPNGKSQTGTSTKATDTDSQQRIASPADGTEDITAKVKSLRLGKGGRLARAFQYEYKLNEQPGSLLVGSGAVRARTQNLDVYLGSDAHDTRHKESY